MSKRSVIVIFLFALICFVSWSTSQNTSQPTSQDESQTTSSYDYSHPLLAKVPTHISEKIFKHTAYTCSYNSDKRNPNYIAWTLTKERVKGKVKRTDTFFEDPELTDNEKARLEDYRGSGYQRGHMCPAGDNKWDKIAMIESFYLSNVCPQIGSLNGGDWKELEESCRELVNHTNDTLHIICGPIYDTSPKRIGGRVAVPEQFFKVILRFNGATQQGIGFIYNNTKANHPMQYYVRSIDEVEKITGFDFFHTLPRKLQKKLESQKELFF